MKLKLTTILLFFFLINGDVSATNYQEGDTLFVVAFSGSVLRSEPNTTSKKLGLIESKSEVIIINTFDFINKDKIDGFEGSWVYVSCEIGSGYVFDAFISTLPLVGKFDWYNSKDKNLDFIGESFPTFLQKYALEQIGKTGCELSYKNRWEGEGLQHFTIYELNDGHQFIDHSYWEGYGSELELINVRESEVYYLIRHLMLPVEVAWKDREYPLRLPQNGNEFRESMGFNKKYFYEVFEKPNNKISILFDLVL